MKLTTTDLSALAAAYSVTPSQLLAPPEVAEMVARLDRAQAIMDGMDPEALEQWLAIGERLRNAS